MSYNEKLWKEISTQRKKIKDYEKVMVIFRKVQTMADSFVLAIFPCWGGNSHADGSCVAYWWGLNALGPYPIRGTGNSRIATSTERYELMCYLKEVRGLSLAIRERAPSMKERQRWIAKGYS